MKVKPTIQKATQNSIFSASKNKPLTLKYSPQHKQQVHIKFKFNTCD